MSGVDERLRKFEAWAETHGADVRAPERRRVAEELLEIAGDEAILELDIETLVKRYKQGLQGAQRILLASRVGREMLEWQEQEISKSVRGAALGGEDERANADEEAESRRVVPGPRIATWRRQSIDDKAESSAEVAHTDDAHADEPARDPGIELDDRRSGAPHSRGHGVIFEPTGERRFDSEGNTSGGVDVDAAVVEGGVEDPRAPGRSMRPGDLEEFRARYRSIEEGAETPPPKIDAEPEPIGVDVAGIKPRLRGSDAPPPHHGPVALEVAAPSERPPPRIVGPGGAGGLYPVGKVSASQPTGSDRDKGWTARLGMDRGAGRVLSRALLVLLGLGAIAILIVRPSFLFPDPGKPVTGLFVSKHLALEMKFPSTFLHAENLDDKGKTKDGYTRKVAVFYQGKSATDFATRIDVVTLDKDGAPADADTARKLGAAETLDAAQRRQCTSFVHGTSHGTACSAIAPGLGDPTPSWMVEEYFDLGGRVVFARALVKAAGTGGAELAPPPLPGAPSDGPISTKAATEETRELVDRLGEINEVLDSIDLAPS